MKVSTLLPSRWGLGVMLSGFVLLGACSYTHEGIPAPACPSLPAAISYKTNVLPILQDECYRCHDTQHYQTLALGTFNMENFNEVKYWSTPANGHNGQSWMIGNMLGDTNNGFKPMPYDGVHGPDACQIALIKAWVDAGAPNN
ncbi:hypothetical protein GKZ68_14025 [Hymenobacter sp. BRD128]|uniref:hypothetical protein n=1 Tax=Hymenobacter sp. BRD128 TaxID=2675878 RepID=UPI0015670449|nr:hypothetical protein [Hymenobacter sp. BRD128]QKG57644.1 hypothetical protein GKZ68_14025 [Hymenobacter sp. BRD128]